MQSEQNRLVSAHIDYVNVDPGHGCVVFVCRKKRRGNTVCSLEEDLFTPVGICLMARVPAKALHVLVKNRNV